MKRSEDAGRVPELPPQPRHGAVLRPARRIGRDGTVLSDFTVAEEVPAALIYNGVAYAVMMLTPMALEAFALGFSLSEGIIDRAGEFHGVAVRPNRLGVELRISIAPLRLARVKERQRNLAGCTGCGLCGIESLREARRELPRVPDGPAIASAAIWRALEQLPAFQPLNRDVGAVHAAAWADASGNILVCAEDVGRHNALDKLIGLLAQDEAGRAGGFLVLTSRCSYELVAKAASVGMSVLVAISAPTSLAIETATATGQTIVAPARGNAMTVYTGESRILSHRPS